MLSVTRYEVECYYISHVHVTKCSQWIANNVAAFILRQEWTGATKQPSPRFNVSMVKCGSIKSITLLSSWPYSIGVHAVTSNE